MAQFDAVNNDTVDGVSGDILISSGQAYGVTRALANSATLALVGVWTLPAKQGYVGKAKDDLVEVNCTSTVAIGDKLYLSSVVPGKATNIPPAYPYFLGVVIARRTIGGVQKALISFRNNGCGVADTQLQVLNGKPATGVITCVAVSALADNDRFTISDGSVLAKYEYRKTTNAYATGTLTCVAASSLLDNETFTLNDGVNTAVVFEYKVQPSVYATGSLTCVDKASLLDNETFTLNDGVNTAVVFEYQVTPNVYATGSLTCVAKDNLLNNETFTLNDGVNTAVVFEYEVDNGTFVATGGDVVVIDVHTLTSAADVATATKTAINGVVATLAITAGAITDATIALTNDAYGAYNTAITDTVVNTGFTHTGMSGGSAFTPAGGNVVVIDVHTLTSAADVATATKTAINNVGAGLAITAGTITDATIALTNDAYGAYNTAITDTVVNVGFTHTGMTGGYIFVPVGGDVVVIDVRSMTAAQVAAATKTAINGVVGTLAITAGDITNATIALTNDAYGAYNTAITDTVVNAGFTHTGMTGGAVFTPTSTYTAIDLRTLTDVTATGVAVLTAATINAGGQALDVPTPTSAVINIMNQAVGTGGNVAMTKSAGAFTVSGMANGVDAVS
jgi:hypothetical protein